MKCPDCGQDLALKLIPESDRSVWCASCGQSVEDATLISGGVDSALVQRLDRWGCDVHELEEMEGWESTATSDRYMEQCRRLRAELEVLRSGLRMRFPIAHVSAPDPVSQPMTDPATAEWRSAKRSSHLWFSYGFQVGAHQRAETGDAATGKGEPALPFPSERVTERDRADFQSGFSMGAQVGSSDPPQLARIRERLRGGFTP